LSLSAAPVLFLDLGPGHSFTDQRNFISADSVLLSSLFLMIHVSEPYSKTGTAKALYSFSFVYLINLAQRLRTRRDVPSLPHMSSWRGA